MWTWEQERRLRLEEPGAELGLVTLGGDPAGVLLGGERRSLPVFSPGGYCWRPAGGDRVLVVKAGAEGESPCVLGVQQDGQGLEPGEVCLSGPDSCIKLGLSGLELTGSIMVNGQLLEDHIKSVVSAALSGGSGG